MNDDQDPLWLRTSQILTTAASDLAWPDRPLAPGERLSVQVLSSGPDLIVQVQVHRDLDLVRQESFTGWESIAFLLGWLEPVAE